MEQNQSLGQKLKMIRMDMGLSQSELAEFLGVHQPTISAYESDSVEPPVSKLVAIAKECNVSLDWLCGLNDCMNLAASTEQVTWFYQYLSSTDDSFEVQQLIKKYW